MIDKNINNDNFKKKLFNGFFESSLNPTDLNETQKKLIKQNLKSLNEKIPFSNYSHAAYVVISDFQAYKYHSGYAITIGDEKSRSYLLFDENLNIDTKRCFFYRDHVARGKKHASFYRDNTFLDFNLDVESNVLNIEEQKPFGDKLIFNNKDDMFSIQNQHLRYTNFYGLKEDTLEYSSYSGDYQNTNRHKINNLNGTEISFVNNITRGIPDCNLDKSFHVKIIGFELIEVDENEYNVYLVKHSEQDNHEQLNFKYNSKNNEISVSSPLEYTIKNKNDIEDFIDIARLTHDTIQHEKLSFYLNNISFFIDIKEQFSKDNSPMKILANRNYYNDLCTTMNNISLYFEGDLKNSYRKIKIQEDFPALKSSLKKSGFQI